MKRLYLLVILVFVVLCGCTRANTSDTLNHEYGHLIQESRMGSFNYIKYIAIPSLIGYFSDLSTAQYYAQPWERSADILGGVEGRRYSYSAETNSNAMEYYIFAKTHY